MAVDALVMLFAYAIAFFARTVVTPRDFINSLGFVWFCIFVMLTAFYVLGLYHRIWRYTSGHEVARIVFGVTAVTAFTLVVDFLFFPEGRPLPLSVIVLGNMLALSGFVGLRYKSRLISGLSWRWEAIWHQKFPESGSRTRVLIVGAGEAGQNFAWRMKHRWPAAMKHEAENFYVIGFADDDPSKRGMYVEGVLVLGGRADIPRLVEQHKIDLIVLAMHNIPGPSFREVLAYCESTKARIRIVPNAYAMMNNTHHAPLLRELMPEDILGRKPIGRYEGIDFAPVTGKVVLVTGAAGSIGSELCRQMLDYGPVALLMLDNNETGLHDMVIELADHSKNGTRLIPVLADVTRREMVEAIFEQYRPQVIFHAAAYKHVPMLELYPHQAVHVNVGGTRNVGDLARQYGAERVVLISTDKAVDPTSVMGASKRLCEYLMHAFARGDNPHGTLFTSVRFGNVLGSRGSVVPMFNKQIDQGGPVTVTDKEMKRFFMTIPEAVNLVIHAACLTEGDDLFMLRMGEEVRILDLAERMIRMRGLRPYEDIPIHFSGVRPGEKLSEELSLEEERSKPTIHPDIVNLFPPLDCFHPRQFLASVEALGRDCPFMDKFASAVHVEPTPSGPVFRAAPNNCLACITRCVDTAIFEDDTVPIALPHSGNGHSGNNHSQQGGE
ncbi:MAG: polysaccharide biosynthesis protein [Anaerolineae bacterium]|nr:polysaccharide biosynthesis protein [Anaerolineae bacterium]